MRSIFIYIAGALLATQASWAARPFAAEDAAVEDPGVCHLETWIDHAAESQHNHVAPACGLPHGLELVLELDAPSQHRTEVHAIASALRWAPESWVWQGWRFGGKLSSAHERAPGDGKHHYAGWSALAIASHAWNDQWSTHLNLGHAHDRIGREDATVFGAALTYSPHERVILFAEINGDNHYTPTQAAGIRYWLIQDVLGLDATVSKANATPNSTTWGVGFGWYGLRF